LSGSTNKKVVVYRFDREPIAGFVNPAAWLASSGVEVLTPSGALTTLPFADLKVVCFVREFEGGRWNNERRSFASRPKTEGLWVRAVFRDNDYVEGILANDLARLEPGGFSLVLPDAFSNTQRAFLPRAALKEFKVLGVIGSARAPRKGKPEGQISLFEE
jgi:hypothetical protein